MLRSSFKHLLLGTALLVTAAASAHADTITQSVQFGPGPANYTSASGAPLLTYFNSNLGTLNSVTFASTYLFNSLITVTSNGYTSIGAVASESAAQFGSTDSTVTAVLNTAVNKLGSATVGGTTLNPVAYDLVGNRSIYSLLPGASQQFTSSKSGSTAAFTDTTASDLSAFFRPGGGTYAILLSTLTGLQVSQVGGGVTASQMTNATANLSVTYDYTAAPTPPVAVTPEPSSLVLLGTGALGLLGAARRRFM